MTGKQLTIEEIKDIALQGLLEFTKLCTQWGIRYYLAFGTLLGAVRHKGFIPWDDDIDLIIPRVDYDRLLSLAGEFKTPEWELLSYNNEPGYLHPYMKYCNRKTRVTPSRFSSGFIYGISIDIFPLDNMPYNNEGAVLDNMTSMRALLKNKEKACFKTGCIQSGLLSSVKRTIKKAAFKMSKSRVEELRMAYKSYDAEMAEKAKDDSIYVAYCLNRYGTVWQKSDFLGTDNEYKELSFEGHMFFVPARYKTVLRKTYGDFMQLPPVEKQKPIHLYKAYYK